MPLITDPELLGVVEQPPGGSHDATSHMPEIGPRPFPCYDNSHRFLIMAGNIILVSVFDGICRDDKNSLLLRMRMSKVQGPRLTAVREETAERSDEPDI